MSFKRHVCRLMQSHQPKTTTNHVWISDELLNSLYHNFTFSITFRRYGSSVPGPLEAQRRAAKRRVMGLARVRGGEEGSTFHPAFLAEPDLGRDFYGWKWQPPTLSPQIPETNKKKGNRPFFPHVRQSRQL